ncbi:MAG: DNA replication/repair protein RecF [Chitinophagaceae bacterium]|nr:DNA replication/repair protein RecF [Chitinophagaceae bacterium]
MLRLNAISLLQFRNYLQREFRFTERIVGICGSNGAGKTNLLDAIYYLSFSKSYLGRSDSQNVHHGSAGMRLEGTYELDGEPQQLSCVLRENNRKELTLNGSEYKKFSDHIGRLPAVMIAPDDVILISGGSEERRKFLDTLLSQLNKTYLHWLIDYNKLLLQRNSLLKRAAEYGQLDEALLQVLNDQLLEKGNSIFRERKQFLTAFLARTGEIYRNIAGKDDGLSLAYDSQLLHGDFSAQLRGSRQKDLQLQRTTVGIHRDDLQFLMDMVPFKSEASQGQRKSLLFALKLAEWETLREKKGFSPILLLDDVFEKLDEQRMFQLLNRVCSETDAQVFITDTHEERLRKQLEDLGAGFQIVELTINN